MSHKQRTDYFNNKTKHRLEILTKPRFTSTVLFRFVQELCLLLVVIAAATTTTIDLLLQLQQIQQLLLLPLLVLVLHVLL